MNCEIELEKMILVTGGTGFLGKTLIDRLTTQGVAVRAIKRKTSSIPDSLKNNNRIEWLDADINDVATLEEVFEGISEVYHCAAFISFDPKDKAQMFRVNIDGTANIVNLCLSFGARLVHVSSIAALGDAKNGGLISEADHWEFDSKAHSYGISKYEGEMEVWRGIAEGLDGVIVNPSVIIGRNAGFEGSGAIFKLVKGGLQFYTDGASGVVDVDDVVDCMIKLMNSGIREERFIISAENLHYKEFFALIASGFGVKAPAKIAKPWMLGIAWRLAKIAAFFTKKAPALTKDAARSSFNLSYYDNSKIKNTLNFKFKPISQSISEVCKALS